MAKVVNCKISDLTQNTKNAVVRAVVISKTKPNYFMARDGSECRGVITFTIRDSKLTVCNCKFWGTKEKVDEYNRKIKICNIISIINPMIVMTVRDTEVFIPKATLPIMLVVNEGSGTLANDEFCNIRESNMLKELLHISHKQLSYALRLDDVRQAAIAVPGNTMSENVNKRTVDLLVVVGAMRPVREINNKTREIAQCLEVIVFDRSVTDGMILSIWNKSWIERAKNWIAMKTILHLIDIAVVESKFHQSIILRFTTQSLAYENPLGIEADALKSYALHLDSQHFNNLLQISYGDKLPNPEDIKTQMTVKQIYMRLEGHLKDDSADHFTAVLYALITKFDIDGLSNVLSRKCKNCQRLLLPKASTCDSEKCLLEFSLNYTDDTFEYCYNINIYLADFTGTITETRLTGNLAERLLMPVTDFRELLARNDKVIEDLKYDFLMNYFKVKLLMKKSNAVRRQAAIIIVDMKRIQSMEIANSIMVF